MMLLPIRNVVVVVVVAVVVVVVVLVVVVVVVFFVAVGKRVGISQHRTSNPPGCEHPHEQT